MLKFHPGVGQLVAADTQNTFAAVDDALLQSVRMFATVLESAKGSNLPSAQSQRLYSGLNAGLSGIVAGRSELVSTLRLLVKIKGESNFAPEDFGCPAGWVPSGSLDEVRAVEPA